MLNFAEQRICIKFCLRNKISCTETTTRVEEIKDLVLGDRRLTIARKFMHHTSVFVCHLLSKNSTNTIPQAPYSPDMTPCDFLFSKLKLPLRGHSFQSINEIKEKIATRSEGYTSN
ncbi:hypothetical protein WH47_08742 [Habropoda laboriosa]|uniref:Histone-lysine N-methyltransferase SETMAR n=1 Tax=Habropoda laboriosa TaxID=597456 RepID=A0A0L7QP76_9HYME|nr:hypothetical protein WH47_08742 [Habropoda laboriosa]